MTTDGRADAGPSGPKLQTSTAGRNAFSLPPSLSRLALRRGLMTTEAEHRQVRLSLGLLYR